MRDTLQLDLALILPDAPDTADACVRRLTAALVEKPGVEKAHVVQATADRPAQLCVHYDAELVGISDIRRAVKSVGAEISDRYGHILWRVEGLRHQRRTRSLAGHLRSVKGVIEADASLSGLVRIEFDRAEVSEDSLRQALADRSVSIEEMDKQAAAGRADPSHTHDEHAHRHSDGKHEHADGHDHAHGGILGKNSELIFASLCGGLLAVGYIAERTGVIPAPVSLGLYISAYFFGGFYTVREAFENLRIKKLEIDSLMLVAAAGAGVLGEWAEGALLLFLFSIGHSMERYAMGRARRAIEALGEIAPAKAEVMRDGQTIEVGVEELVVGDNVIARPNSRIPADGFVVKGTSSVNQAPLTGESVPVDKQPVADANAAAERPNDVSADRRVYAGTINGAGALEIRVTRTAADNTLARVVKMVAEAETQKSPTQRFTDRFERFFVPTVLGFVALLLLSWTVTDESFRDSFYRALAVLVAASPCALAIATPSAVLSGVARAARGGVLVKGGGPLENLGSLTAIAFDKTGTLTEGKPRVTDVHPTAGSHLQELLTTAVAVERRSDHPLAAAVVRDAGQQIAPDSPIPEASDVRSIIGKGVSAVIDGQVVLIGKLDLFTGEPGNRLPADVEAAARKLESQGRTVMIVKRGGRYLGVIGLMDQPRTVAKEVIARLRKLGIKQIIMLTGDNPLVARAVGNEVDVDRTYGNLMPEDKVATIAALGAEQQVAMVGDGVNDAPAMANATVGIAMGAAGSDVALETADVALMADDLRHLPFAVGLSRSTRRIIRQNLWVSLGMVAFLIPATVFGLQIGAAVLLHEGSTILVVVNALRLLAYRDTSDATA